LKLLKSEEVSAAELALEEERRRADDLESCLLEMKESLKELSEAYDVTMTQNQLYLQQVEVGKQASAKLEEMIQENKKLKEDIIVNV
jgi:hypothetical protein